MYYKKDISKNTCITYKHCEIYIYRNIVTSQLGQRFLLICLIEFFSENWVRRK